jgi:outer membrane protein
VNLLRLKQAGGTISLADLQEVNRVLVNDAEAALDNSGTL